MIFVGLFRLITVSLKRYLSSNDKILKKVFLSINIFKKYQF